MRKLLIRLLGGHVHEPGSEHDHGIDHEEVARRYFSHLTIAQRPIADLENMPIPNPSLRQWLTGYAAWYDACVAPLMKEQS